MGFGTNMTCALPPTTQSSSIPQCQNMDTLSVRYRQTFHGSRWLPLLSRHLTINKIGIRMTENRQSPLANKQTKETQDDDRQVPPYLAASIDWNCGG